LCYNGKPMTADFVVKKLQAALNDEQLLQAGGAKR